MWIDRLYYMLLVEILESSHLTASNSSRFVRDQRTKISFQSWVANANAYSNSCYRNEQSHLKVNCDDFQRHIKSAVRWKYRFMYIDADIFFISPKDWKIAENKTELNVYGLPRFEPKSQSKHTFSTMCQIEFALPEYISNTRINAMISESNHLYLPFATSETQTIV